MSGTVYRVKEKGDDSLMAKAEMETAVYTWAPSTPDFHSAKVDVQAVGQELQRIAEAGKLTADAVVEKAKVKKSPLHDAFDWDLDKAAHEHWKKQARSLIAALRIIKTDEAGTVSQHRAFFNVVNPDGHEYVTRSKVAASKDYREQVLNDAIRWLQRAQERIADIEGLEKEATMISRIVKKVTKVRETAHKVSKVA